MTTSCLLPVYRKPLCDVPSFTIHVSLLRHSDCDDEDEDVDHDRSKDADQDDEDNENSVTRSSP